MSKILGIALSGLLGLGAGYLLGSRTSAPEPLQVESQGSSIAFKADSPGAAWLIMGNYASDAPEVPPGLSRNRLELAQDRADGVVVFRLEPAFSLNGIEKIPCTPAMCTIPPKPRPGFDPFQTILAEGERIRTP